MIVTSTSAWDLGITFGIDNEVFDQALIDRLNTTLGPEITIKQSDAPHLSLTPAIGSGLRLDLLHSELPKRLTEFAADQITSKEGRGVLSTMVFVDFFIDVFSLGIAYIQYDVRYRPGADPKILEEIGIALEEGTMTRESEYLKQLGRDIVDSCTEIGRTDTSTSRSDLSSATQGYFFPGFTDVLLPEEGDDRSHLESYIRKYNSDLTVIDTDDGVLFFGWAISAFFPNNDTDYSKIICILKYSQVFNEITIAFEKLFTGNLNSVWRSMLNGFKNEAPDFMMLQRLRTLASAIIGVTRFSTITQDEDNLFIFRAFNKVACIESRHDRIREASEVFHLIEVEYLRAKEETRQKQLSMVIFFLTSLTFITVLADILTTVDYTNSLLPSYMGRFALLLSLPAMAIILVWLKLFHSKKKG